MAGTGLNLLLLFGVPLRCSNLPHLLTVDVTRIQYQAPTSSQVTQFIKTPSTFSLPLSVIDIRVCRDAETSATTTCILVNYIFMEHLLTTVGLYLGVP